jgi:hypothetical protein
VFARASPQNKIQIVKALQAEGEVCSMTGDGVNGKIPCAFVLLWEFLVCSFCAFKAASSSNLSYRIVLSSLDAPALKVSFVVVILRSIAGTHANYAFLCCKYLH